MSEPHAADLLVKWYASNPVVRRLWAIDEDDALRVVVMLEPTFDGDDTGPTWFANCRAWTRELEARMDRAVRMELVNDASCSEPCLGGDALITAISWRDASMWD